MPAGDRLHTTWFRCVLASAVCALLLVTEATAEEGADTPEAVSQAVAKAVSAGDDAQLAVLAARTNPDPWRTADALLASGKSKEALAFAQAATGKATEGLAAYVESAPAEAELSADRKALEEAAALYAKRRHKHVVKRLEGHPAVDRSVIAVRIHELRGRALEDLAKYEESAASHAAGADLARGIGWFAQESTALYQAGVALWMKNDFEGMRPHFDRRLAVETMLGCKAGIGRAHRGLASIYQGLDDYPNWEEHDKKAEALAKESGDTHYIAKSLSQEAYRLAQAGDPESALRKIEEQIAVLENVASNDLPARFQPDPQALIESRVRAGLMCVSLCADLTRPEKAREHGKAAIRAARRLKKKTLVDYARGHVAFVEGRQYESTGHDLKALAEYDNATRLYERAGEREKHAEVLGHLSYVYARMGNFTRAAALAKQALDVLEDIGAQVLIAQARMAYASILTSQGRLEGAKKHWQAALEAARKLKLPQLEVDALGGLGRFYGAAGDPARARRYVDEALGRHVADAGLGNYGAHLVQLATIQSAARDRDAALKTLSRAESQLEKEGVVSNLRSVRRMRARVLSQVGRSEEATKLLLAVLDAERQGANTSGIAQTLHELANVHVRDRDYAAAVPIRREALGLYVAAANRQNVVKARVQLGRDLFFAGERDEALGELETAADEARDIEHPILIAWAELGLTEWNLFQKQYEEAMAHARDAYEAIESFGLGLSDEEGAGLRSEFAALSWMGAAAATYVGDVGQAYEFLERGRAATLLAALGGRRAVREFTVPAALREAEAKARDDERFAAAAFEQTPRNDFKARTARKAEWKAAIDWRKEVSKKIQREARAQADLAYIDIQPLDAVRKTLADHEALVVYARIQADAMAIVATKAGARMVKLGASADIRATVEELLESGEYVNEAAVGPARKALIDALKLTPKTTRLLISPDPALAYVPFGVLDQTREAVLIPSGTTYGMLRTMEATPSTRILALGDPDYRAPASAGNGGGAERGGERGAGVLPRIKATGEEVEAIAAGDEHTRLLRANATIPRLRQELVPGKQWKAVHLACHGHVDPERAAHSWLALSGEGQASATYLRMADVFELEIKAELVVLSGCETGLGTYVAGEGLRGMTRAFMLAGAKRVIASLWKVNDKATLELMKKFYALWSPKQGKGISAAAALRRAQNHVRDFKDEKGKQKWKHPEYWAAWVLWGLPD